MYKVGITGGIGSGKSTMCKVFRHLGVPVYDADSRAKALLLESAEVKKKVISSFSAKAYLPDGTVDRAYLSQEVFSDPEKRSLLNSIVHPAVRLDFEIWMEEQDAPYVLKEAAILIESGAYKEVDEIIVVEAEANTRLKRVMDRDEVTEDKVKARMEAQISDADRSKYANHKINNNDDSLVIPQILRIHEDIISRTSS